LCTSLTSPPHCLSTARLNTTSPSAIVVGSSSRAQTGPPPPLLHASRATKEAGGANAPRRGVPPLLHHRTSLLRPSSLPAVYIKRWCKWTPLSYSSYPPLHIEPTLVPVGDWEHHPGERASQPPGWATLGRANRTGQSGRFASWAACWAMARDLVWLADPVRPCAYSPRCCAI
jgi:hypothetical protein